MHSDWLKPAGGARFEDIIAGADSSIGLLTRLHWVKRPQKWHYMAVMPPLGGRAGAIPAEAGDKYANHG